MRLQAVVDGHVLVKQKQPNTYTRHGISNFSWDIDMPRALSARVKRRLGALDCAQVVEGLTDTEGRGSGLVLLCDMWSSKLSIFDPASYESSQAGGTATRLHGRGRTRPMCRMYTTHSEPTAVCDREPWMDGISRARPGSASNLEPRIRSSTQNRLYSNTR